MLWSVNAPDGQTSADALNVPTLPLLGEAVTVSVSVNCVGALDCALPCRASAAEAPTARGGDAEEQRRRASKADADEAHAGERRANRTRSNHGKP